MVTITGFQTKKRSDGTTFNVLNLLGGVEAIMSKNGKPYLSARKANMICGLSETECQALVNTKLPGLIVKKECEEYSYVVPGSNESVMLNYTYAYDPNATETMEDIALNTKHHIN